MSKSRKLEVIIGLIAVAIVAITGALLSMLSTPYETTRIRNSLIAQIGKAGDFAWKPTNPPGAFLLEQAPVPPEFREIARQVMPESASLGNWEKSIAIARHLSKGPGIGGGAIQSNTLAAYRTILSENRGYCSDYTQVFNGIALAAGIPVREWGMSFDGFSGYGHAFNEIYDDRLDKWMFIDSFYSFYVKDSQTGVPLSSLEFRERLLAEDPLENLEVVPIEPDRFGFASAAQAIQYYERGADQLFLWFGNNVFSYDSHIVVKALGPWSRALEQSGAIVTGIHPSIRIIASESNRKLIDRLFLTRNMFALGVLVLLLLSMVLIFFIRGYRLVRASTKDRGLFDARHM